MPGLGGDRIPTSGSQPTLSWSYSSSSGNVHHHQDSAPGDNDSIDPLTDAVVDVLGKDSPILAGIAGTRDMDHE